MKTLVINIFGEPCVGKSTAATYIYSQLKKNGVNCEYVSEFAKDKCYEGNNEVFKNQEYIFGKQSFKMSRVKNKVNIIVTDSPLILPSVYNDSDILGNKFNDVVLNVFNSYENFNILLERKHEYKKEVRNQNEEESVVVRTKIIDTLTENSIPYINIISDFSEYDKLIKLILKKYERTLKDEQ